MNVNAVSKLKLYGKNSIVEHAPISLSYTQQERWAPATSTAWCTPYMGVLKVFEIPWVRTRLLFPKFLGNGLLFRSILWMCVQNVKFVWGTLKLWAVPGYAHAHFSPKFFMVFVWMDPVNVPAKFWVRLTSVVTNTVCLVFKYFDKYSTKLSI